MSSSRLTKSRQSPTSPKPDLDVIDVIRYIYFWKTDEEKLLTRFANSDSRQNAFKDYVIYMRIARNFKKGSTNKVLRVVDQYTNDAKKLSVNELSQRLHRAKLLPKKNRAAYVACSKILWLYDRSFVIMDRNNVKALKLLQDDSASTYDHYESIWKRCYKDYLPRIDATITEYRLDKILKEVKQNWFKQRVFDKFLWEKVFRLSTQPRKPVTTNRNP